MQPQSLAERLGLKPNQRGIILCAELLGFSHAHTIGINDTFVAGGLASARLMVPAPWSRGAVSHYRGQDVGVNIVVNSEHPIFHFGPITFAPTLVDGSGGFPATIDDLWDHADLDEVRHEIRAQLERAIYWGFDVTHLASHLHALIGRPEFFDLLTDLAQEFRLPIQLPRNFDEQHLGFPAAQLAADKGVIVTDDSLDVSGDDTIELRSATSFIQSLAPRLNEGVTEVTVRVAIATPELQALTTAWSPQVQLKNLLCNAQELTKALADHNIVHLNYRALREVSRSA